MRYFYLFFAALILTACSKEDTYGPWNLKNGQEVTVMVSHRYGAINDELLFFPKNKPAEMSLYNFADREPGYTYQVKAEMVAEKDPPQDGPAYYLKYIKTLDRAKYEGNESFEVEIIQSYIPGGPMIILTKEGEKYFIRSKIQLTYSNAEIGNQLEEIWKNREEIRQNYEDEIFIEPKWRSVRVTVNHDSNNFGKAYKVSHIEFKN